MMDFVFQRVMSLCCFDVDTSKNEREEREREHKGERQSKWKLISIFMSLINLIHVLLYLWKKLKSHCSEASIILSSYCLDIFGEWIYLMYI